MITNLLNNAIRHTDAGGKVTVQVQSNDSRTKLSVIDTGCGIASQHLDRIFDRLYQVVQDEQEPVSGLGLGLNLSKQIIELHKGSIFAESELGKGSTFSFNLPKQKEAVEQQR